MTINFWLSLAVATDIAQRQVLRYASYCYDSESGMYYLSCRHYDPGTRQFLAKDLSRNDGEQSAYQYCLGNPVGMVDPSGYIPAFETGSRETDRQALKWWNKRQRQAAKERADEYARAMEAAEELWAQDGGRYDGDAAADYADQWAEGYNPDYKDIFNARPSLADCTYFASQCLHAGGIPYNRDWYYLHRPLMKRFDQWSPSFSQANTLYNFLLDSGVGVPLATYPASSAPSSLYTAGIKPGDIIFYDWDGHDGKMDHTAVVSVSNINVTLIDQHDSNRLQRDWRTKPEYNEHFETAICHPVHITY